MRTLTKKLFVLLFLLPITLLAQNKLEGVVIDKKDSQPLPGVNVKVKESTSGTTTSFDGTFVIGNLKKGDIISFSFLGYNEQTITYNGQNNVTISLTDQSTKLNEVVVVGYGSVKKKDVTGSVDLITSKEFNKGPVVSVDQLLVGKAAGVRITSTGGAPDTAPNIRIRGGASISSQNNPLIVIDGVPLSFVNAAGNGNPLSLINPNDIESFSILKDASATAIYGSRASNGVIIITTKKGSSGKPQFEFSSSIAIGKAQNLVNMMDGDEFANFIRTRYPQHADKLGVADPNNPSNRIIYNTDWQDAVLRTSVSSDNNFSVKANLFKKIPFRASVGYTKNEGLVKTNDFERYTASLKLTPTLLDNHLKIDVNAKLLSSKKNVIDEGGALGGAINMDPTKPIYDYSSTNRFDGYHQDLNAGNISGSTNPLAILEQRRRPEEVKKLLGNVEFDYKFHFLPELRAVLNLGTESSVSNISEVFTGNAIQTYQNKNGGVFNPGENYSEHQTITNNLLDAYLVYTKEMKGFLQKWDIQGGYTYQNFKNDGTKKIYRYNDTSGLREEVIPTIPNNRYYNVTNLQSFFGRTNFDFANKYLFTLSFRADGSSLFQENNRWGYFPSAAFAWKIKSENFLKNTELISDLKLRLGWGKTGQQDITGAVGYYPTSPLFQTSGSSSQYLPGFNSYSALPFDPSLTWEKATTYNAGLDFELFKNRIISGSIDVYQREVTDLLALVDTPPGQALKNKFVTNIGTVKGRGAETSLTVRPINKENISWELNGNLAFAYNEVTDLKGRSAIQDDSSGLPIGTGVRLAYYNVGFQPYSAWVLEQIYDGNGNPIEGAFVDRNGDNKIDDNDKVFKALRPNWTFGFGTSFNYKNFDLNASFRGQFGGLVYNARLMQSGNAEQVVPVNSTSLTNILSGEPVFQDNNDPRYFSDYFLEDATFLRCENITLGYKFNQAIKNATLRLYIAGNNLFLITKYKGQDPENFNAIDNNFYPRPKIYSFGVNLNF